MARVALLACIGGLAFVMCSFCGYLPWLLPASAFFIIASLCNTLKRGAVLEEPTSELCLHVSTCLEAARYEKPLEWRCLDL